MSSIPQPLSQAKEGGGIPAPGAEKHPNRRRFGRTLWEGRRGICFDGERAARIKRGITKARIFYTAVWIAVGAAILCAPSVGLSKREKQADFSLTPARDMAARGRS
ncbi:hypothetical protein HMPREF0262_03565 [Clostridium sp. ATCC 29733]|nr:hypothetical protein HMPREF0262_03565 [Clostridium sp. ATCC 29733]